MIHKTIEELWQDIEVAGRDNALVHALLEVLKYEHLSKEYVLHLLVVELIKENATLREQNELWSQLTLSKFIKETQG